MTTITVQEIERDPLAFVRRLEAGEQLLLVQDGRTLAHLRPIRSSAYEPRPHGLCAGEFALPADFDRPLPEGILDTFEQARDSSDLPD